MNYKLLTLEKIQGPCDNTPHYELSAVIPNIGEVVLVSRDFEYPDDQPTFRKDSDWYISRFGMCVISAFWRKDRSSWNVIFGKLLLSRHFLMMVGSMRSLVSPRLW